jgi:hypothetical protein
MKNSTPRNAAAPKLVVDDLCNLEVPAGGLLFRILYSYLLVEAPKFIPPPKKGETF